MKNPEYIIAQDTAQWNSTLSKGEPHTGNPLTAMKNAGSMERSVHILSYEEVSENRGAPSSHPFLDGIIHGTSTYGNPHIEMHLQPSRYQQVLHSSPEDLLDGQAKKKAQKKKR